MTIDWRDVVTSAAFAFLAGLVLWPPGAIYWSEVAGLVGGGPTLAMVGTAAVVLAVAFEYVADVSLPSFALGTVLAYAAGMVAILVALSPDSPVHLLWYALLAVCLFVGAVSVVVFKRGDVDVPSVYGA